MLVGGADYLMKQLPDQNEKNIYYWFYATQVMHNIGDAQWQAWNRKMRDLLVKTQCRDENCSKGSWDPDNVWGHHGGRLMQTSLSCLTLEVYYRYPPLYDSQVPSEKPKSLGPPSKAATGYNPKNRSTQPRRRRTY